MPRWQTRFALVVLVLLAVTPAVLAPRLHAAVVALPPAPGRLVDTEHGGAGEKFKVKKFKTESADIHKDKIKDHEKDKERHSDAGKYVEGEDDSGPAHLGAITGYRLLDIEWQPGPFPGSEIAVMAGDPKAGIHTTYLRLASGTRIPPHWHSFDELVTVVEGLILFGQGEKTDAGATRLFGPGAFVNIPAKVPHYAWAKSQVILSQTRAGAADFHWVNPDDDPAKANNTKAPEQK
jgi:quercetin dioxygenase-like cupin family protein